VEFEPFFEYLPHAPARILLLDLDGTLAPFEANRSSVKPYPGIREVLRQIVSAGRTRLAVMSGRGVEDLRRVLDLEPTPELWGGHGWERIDAAGESWRREVPADASAALDRTAEALAALRLGDRIERKYASIAVHLRGLSPSEAERVRAASEVAIASASSDALSRHAFDGGVEVRVSGWDKGDAVLSILASEPLPTAVAYLGDDETDEDAFRALRGAESSGRAATLTVLVRPEPRATEATHYLEPASVLGFLRRWRDASRSG
jgi:trehalose 6-phosphate phosphatase